MRKSIGAVLLGILLALGIGVLEILGIVAPVFTRFFGQEMASTAVPTIVLVFAAAFAFYFGGMIASYRAPSRRRLHGVMVGVVSFTISPLVNLLTSALTASENDPFANLRTPGAALLTGVLFAAVIVASYVGARRGETLHAHNEMIARQRQRRQKRATSDQR